MDIRVSKTKTTLAIVALAVVAHANVVRADARLVERGRYVASTSGCNDCHTPGYMETEGNVPEAQWLTGNTLGFQGPWGTSYPANLRLYMAQLTEAQWLERARRPLRPPMPWFNLRDMSEQDLRALYHYIRALGPAGDPAPAALAPGQTPVTPYIDFAVKNLPTQARK